MSTSQPAPEKSSSGRFFAMVKYLDFFSEGVNLNVGGHAVFRTPYGSLFTCAYLAIMIFIVVSAIEKYLDTTKPIAVGEMYSTSEVPEINLYNNKLLPVVVAYSNETEFIRASNLGKYFTIKTEKINWVAKTIPGTDEATLEKVIDLYRTVPCSELTDQQMEVYKYIGTDSFYYKTLRTYGLCSLIPNDTTVKGRISDKYFSQVVLKVLPCSLVTGCATEDEMMQVNFQIIVPSSNLNVANSKNPHDFTIRADEVYFVTPMLRQIYLAKLKEFTVMDYEGFIPTWMKETTVHDIGTVTFVQTSRKAVTKCTAQQVTIPDNIECLPYFEFLIQTSGQKVINKRTYVTLSQTLSTIGGTNSVIIIVMLMIYGPINEKKRKEYMTRKVYSLLGVKEEDLEKGLDYLEKRKAQARQTLGPHDESPERPLASDTQQDNSLNIRIKTDKKWWQCCCCRKKSESELELEKTVRRAQERILDSLDVLSIVRNFNELKVLTHFFFEERHFDLAQYVGFDLWQAERDERIRRLKEDNENPEVQTSQRDITMDRRNLRKVKMSHRILSEKQRFNQWMDYILHKHNNRVEDKPEITNEVANELDEFYFKKLYPNHGLKTIDGMIDLVNQLMRNEVDPGDIPSVDAGDINKMNYHKRRSSGMLRPDLASDDPGQIEPAYKGEDVSEGKKEEGFGNSFGGLFNNLLSQGLPEQGEQARLKQSGLTLSEGIHNQPNLQNPNH